jgi:hypothetical protein
MATITDLNKLNENFRSVTILFNDEFSIIDDDAQKQIKESGICKISDDSNLCKLCNLTIDIFSTNYFDIVNNKVFKGDSEHGYNNNLVLGCTGDINVPNEWYINPSNKKYHVIWITQVLNQNTFVNLYLFKGADNKSINTVANKFKWLNNNNGLGNDNVDFTSMGNNLEYAKYFLNKRFTEQQASEKKNEYNVSSDEDLINKANSITPQTDFLKKRIEILENNVDPTQNRVKREKLIDAMIDVENWISIREKNNLLSCTNKMAEDGIDYIYANVKSPAYNTTFEFGEQFDIYKIMETTSLLNYNELQMSNIKIKLKDILLNGCNKDGNPFLESSFEGNKFLTCHVPVNPQKNCYIKYICGIPVIVNGNCSRSCSKKEDNIQLLPNINNQEENMSNNQEGNMSNNEFPTEWMSLDTQNIVLLENDVPNVSQNSGCGCK